MTFMGSKYAKHATAARTLPRTPLGELTEELPQKTLVGEPGRREGRKSRRRGEMKWKGRREEKKENGREADWIVQCFTSPPTQYRLYGRRFLQVKRPNQQYQSTEGESCKGKTQKTERKQKLHICIHTQNSRQIQRTTITQQVP